MLNFVIVPDATNLARSLFPQHPVFNIPLTCHDITLKLFPKNNNPQQQQQKNPKHTQLFVHLFFCPIIRKTNEI